MFNFERLRPVHTFRGEDICISYSVGAIAAYINLLPCRVVLRWLRVSCVVCTVVRSALNILYSMFLILISQKIS